MTREDFKEAVLKKAKESIKDEFDTSWQKIHLLSLYGIIEDHFDGIESRVCGNCEHSGDCTLEEIALAEFDFQDFGCTEFERKYDD